MVRCRNFSLVSFKQKCDFSWFSTEIPLLVAMLEKNCVSQNVFTIV